MNIEAVQKLACKLYADYLNILINGCRWVVYQDTHESADGNFGIYDNLEPTSANKIRLRDFPNEDFTDPVKNNVLDIRDGFRDPVLMSISNVDEYRFAGLAWLATAEGD
jgi:hypothetical protein